MASVGVLGIISVMGLAFATVMRLEARAARNYTESVRAEFVGRAGIEDAIVRLRIMAREGAETSFLVRDPVTGVALAVGRPADWYTWCGTAGGDPRMSFPAEKETNFWDDDEDGKIDATYDTDGEGTGPSGFTDWVDEGCFYTLKIEDAASKINVNAGDNLGTVLDNLCRAIGPPLAAADQRALVPKWFSRRATYRSYERDRKNVDDRLGIRDLFYRLNKVDGRPLCESTDGAGCGRGRAIYGDGYAIAGYRARHGEFLSLEDVRNALTWIERGDGDSDGDAAGVECDMLEEQLEIEAKFAALRPYITIDSYCDTDQVGYGKFEQIMIQNGRAVQLTDRNACWNVRRNRTDGAVPMENDFGGDEKYCGELAGCYVAIVNGVGQNQIKTIRYNTIDTLFLGDSGGNDGNEMRVPPNQHSSYIIIGRDAATDAGWQQQLRLYARQPLSFHRSPVNINTASDKVLVAVLMGLQTTWGRAGYVTQGRNIDDMGGWAGTSDEWADAMWQCPSVVSLGRDDCNAYLTFGASCPNDKNFTFAGANQQLFGHTGGAPYCFFCSFGHLCPEGNRISSKSSVTRVNEAHYLAWQILKEREQTASEDLSRVDDDGRCWSNGYGPFRGWDDIFYRVFYPHEQGLLYELHATPQRWVSSSKTTVAASTGSPGWTARTRHPGISRLCMANFNSNTGLLKFQPNLEYIDRWGPNFTDLFLPRPELLLLAGKDKVDIKLRVRPGELLDKSDLNIGTTEFCFDSGGIYDIESIGRVYDKAKTVTAERKFRALVKVYDVWRESTQREFAKGVISEAQGTPGSVQAGQFALDGSDEAHKDVRKALCTYPEPIVPEGHQVGKVIGQPPDLVTTKLPRTAALAYDVANPVLQPAGYDGQILLATNVYCQTLLENGIYVARTTDNKVAGDLGFYHSFTGDTVADTCKGLPLPGTGKSGSFVLDPQNDPRDNCPLDKVSLLGALDAPDCDLAPTRVGDTVVEGEGKGGDFRADGVHLGVVGAARMDGAFEFRLQDSMEKMSGAVTMWIKPMWHHGTVTRASLPVNYDTDGGDQRGTTVCIPRVVDYGPADAPGTSAAVWTDYWRVSPSHRYESAGSIGTDAAGFVRDRFEFELFNAVLEAEQSAANNFRFYKAGDVNSSMDDMDWWGSYKDGRPPMAALVWSGDDYPSTNGSQENASYMPGHLAADGRPFYQMAPFRWSFVGFIWDIQGLGVPPDWPQIPAWSADPTTGRGESGPGWDGRDDLGNYSHRDYGQPLEMSTLVGDLMPGGTGHGQMAGFVCDWGNEVCGDQDGNLPFSVAVPFGHRKDFTADEHYRHIGRMIRPFSDGMRTWNKRPPPTIRDDGKPYDVRKPFEGGYDMEDWAFEQYGSMIHGWGTTSYNEWAKPSPPGWFSFGINKASSFTNYQAFYSGTYATMDEYKIHLTALGKHANEALVWPHDEWRKTGRYYFPLDTDRNVDDQIDDEAEPSFESQTMLESEQNQSVTFDPGEENDLIEVCTVRWTAFAPYFCLEKGPSWSGSVSEWTFPFSGYFDSDDGSSRFETTFRAYASPAQIRLFWKTGQGRLADNKFGEDTGPFKTELRQKGVASRISSQRGCKVKIQARDDSGNLVWFPRTAAKPKGLFYEYPEGGYDSPLGCTEDGWQQVLTPTDRHPKCKPEDLKYRVFFRLSKKEYEEMKRAKMALVDSPVFDDITVTWMRRPRVLEWREVSE